MIAKIRHARFFVGLIIVSGTQATASFCSRKQTPASCLPPCSSCTGFLVHPPSLLLLLSFFMARGGDSGPCGAEAGAHGHGHDHGHHHDHDHDHDHDHGEDAGGEEWSLYQQVDLPRSRVLNAAHPSAALAAILRPRHARTDTSLPVVTSDADEQLLICLSFVCPVKIKSICVIGGAGSGGLGNPAHMAAFVNPPEGFDFLGAEGAKSTQDWELVRETVAGGVEYPTRFTRFQNVSSLALFIDRNFGADETIVQYVGLKGEFTRYRREAVVTTYEARPLAGDHKAPDENKPSMDLA